MQSRRDASIAALVEGFFAMADRAALRRYGIIVGVEFALAGVGAGILGGSGQAACIPVWICTVVGVHFFALAPVLGDRTPIPLGNLLCAVALVALLVGLRTDVRPSAVTGIGAGAALAGFGIAALTRGLGTAPA